MSTLRNILLHSKHKRDFLADVFYVADGTPKPIVIFSHGFKGFKNWGTFDLVGELFAKAGFVFVKHNFSHNGTTIDHPIDFADLEAFGNNNFSIELDDLGVVIDWVVSDSFPVNSSEKDISKIFLMGHSRGGGITLLKAGEDPRINKVATWASVNEFGKFWKQEQMKKIKEEGVIYTENSRTKQRMPIYWQLYQNYFDNLSRLFIPAVVKRLSVPLLIVHGTNDDAVPYSAATEMKQWKHDAKLLTIENGNHVFGSSHPWRDDHLPADIARVVNETIQFFKEQSVLL